MRQSELIQGRVYVSSYLNQGEYIFMWEGDGSGAMINNYKDSHRYNSGRSSIVESNGFFDFREASYEEEQQLLMSIEARKFIPRSIINYSIY